MLPKPVLFEIRQQSKSVLCGLVFVLLDLVLQTAAATGGYELGSRCAEGGPPTVICCTSLLALTAFVDLEPGSC
jgi:hypothetical protein